MGKQSKYRSKKTTVYGIEFASKKEANRYLVLRSMQEAGEISGLELWPKYILLHKFRYKGKMIRAITYTPDFRYQENGVTVVEEVKGSSRKATSRDFVLRWKLLVHKYPEIDYRIIE